MTVDVKDRGTWSERARYAFDKSMAAGPIALIGWLSLITLLIIVVASTVISLTGLTDEGAEPLSYSEALWQSLMRTMDAGTMAGDTGWPFRFITLAITLAGIFVFSALIGILSSGINDRLVELRKGRSRVLEQGHTIILNWSPSIFDIIAELKLANESESRPRLVIMAAKDKAEMEDEIADKAGDLGRLRIICRSGDPTDLYDLTLTNPRTSKSIVVLSPDGSDADAQVVKTILALVHDPRRRKEPYRIAAEIRATKNARIAGIVGGGEVQLVLADELIALIVAHSARQAGLSAVYSELLSFEGGEIYTADAGALAGKTYGEAILAYDTGALIGLCDPQRRVKVNPPMDTVIAPGSLAIVIAEDNDAIRIAPMPAGAIDAGALREAGARGKVPERALVLGWNHRGPMIVRELSAFLDDGSLMTIVSDLPDAQKTAEALAIERPGLRVDYRAGDPSDREILHALNPGSYEQAVVLSDIDTLSAQSADTKTLVTLLHLREIADSAGEEIGIVSEMADLRNRELAEVTRADDFVVSNRLVSMMLAQASENEYASAIFGDLLDEEGSEIHMRPAGDYVALETPVTFYTVAEAARRRGHSAIGYCRRRDHSPEARGKSGVVLAPRKSDKVTFQAGDRMIVLAED